MWDQDLESVLPPKSEIEPKRPRQLLKMVRKALTLTQNHHQLKYTKYQNQIELYIIEKKPLYLSDGDTCIQASIGPPQKLPLLNPFNKSSTPFYAAHQKPQVVFNCHNQSVTQEPSIYPSPYEPCYHFKDYNRFKKGRAQAQILVSCERLLVTDWTLILVNISNSGYYAPFMVVNSHTKIKEPFKLDRAVENIIFCNILTPFLQKSRSRDIRKESIIPQKKQNSFEYSLAYHMRYQTNSVKMPTRSCLVNLDKQGSYISFKPSKQSYIPIGNLPKVSLFKRPVQNKYINIKQIKMNYQVRIIDDQNMSGSQEDQSEAQLWSDDQQQQGRASNLLVKKQRMVNNQNEPRIGNYQISEQDGIYQIDRRNFMEEQVNSQQQIEISSEESDPDILATLYKSFDNRGNI